MKQIFNFIMQKFLLICIFMLTLFFAQHNVFISDKKIVAYQTETIVYAKANNDCAIYKNINEDFSLDDVLFYVPNTYFVTILSKVNDDISKVQYENYTGYVYSRNIKTVSFTPTKPILLGITFDILENVGTQIWSKPSDTDGRILTTISAGTIKIYYVASTLGDIPIGGRSNLWYYARYTPATNSTNVYEGYIYSESTTNLSHIPNNLEQDIEEINNPTEQALSLSPTFQIVLLSIVVLPFVALIAVVIIKIIKESIRKRHENQTIKLTEKAQIETLPANNTFTRKNKNQKLSNSNQEIEVVFPEYDYIDDDDLL